LPTASCRIIGIMSNSKYAAFNAQSPMTPGDLPPRAQGRPGAAIRPTRRFTSLARPARAPRRDLRTAPRASGCTLRSACRCRARSSSLFQTSRPRRSRRRETLVRIEAALRGFLAHFRHVFDRQLWLRGLRAVRRCQRRRRPEFIGVSYTCCRLRVDCHMSCAQGTDLT